MRTAIIIISGIVLTVLSVGACRNPEPQITQTVCVDSNTGETMDPKFCSPTPDQGSVEIEIDRNKPRTLPKYTPTPKTQTTVKPAPVVPKVEPRKPPTTKRK